MTHASTASSSADVALAYKSALGASSVPSARPRSTLDVWPIYHHRDATTLGHIIGCFLALRLKVDLQRRLDAREVDARGPTSCVPSAEFRLST